jgi:uncharacterized membrane protein YgdD (TMEM256/DUF423 family)
MDWLRIAGLTGALGVGFGAFGSHALRGRIADNYFTAYQTGVLYHLVHAAVLVALALYARATSARIGVPAGLLVAGIILFSGSLYVMALTSAVRLGMVTPMGGLCFIGGWVAIAFTLTRPAARPSA